MTFAHTIGNKQLHVRQPARVAGKGDASAQRRCAGRAWRRDSAEERVAAQFALADVPLAQFLAEEIVPYENDEVTRLIVDTHDAEAFAPVRIASRWANCATGCSPMRRRRSGLLRWRRGLRRRWPRR